MSTINDLAGNPRNMRGFMDMFSEMFGKKYQSNGEKAFKEQQEKQAEEQRKQKAQKRIIEIRNLLASPDLLPEQRTKLNDELYDLENQVNAVPTYGFNRNGTGPFGSTGGLSRSGESPYDL